MPSGQPQNKRGKATGRIEADKLLSWASKNINKSIIEFGLEVSKGVSWKAAEKGSEKVKNRWVLLGNYDFRGFFFILF